MATVYINADSGDDGTGDGSSGTPWETLSHAIDNSSADDTIVCQDADATYDFPNKTFSDRTIEASTYGDAVFDGESNNRQWVLSGTVAFNKLKFQNINHPGAEAIFAHADGASPTLAFTDCVFDNLIGLEASHNGGLFGGDGDVSGSLTVTFTRCAFINLDSGNTFSTNGTTTSPSDLTFTFNECTFDASGLTQVFYRQVNSAGLPIAVTWRNSIFYASSSVTLESEGSQGRTYVASYSCFYQLTGSPSGTGVITSDPLFVDTDADNYELRPSSPCVNTGTLV